MSPKPVGCSSLLCDTMLHLHITMHTSTLSIISILFTIFNSTVYGITRRKRAYMFSTGTGIATAGLATALPTAFSGCRRNWYEKQEATCIFTYYSIHMGLACYPTNSKFKFCFRERSRIQSSTFQIFPICS